MRIKEFNELTDVYKELVQASIEAQSLSYAPYSKFHVGSSILLENGNILKGANQENASYPLCLCAERVALCYSAMRHPKVEIKCLVVSTSAKLSADDMPPPPCGACRQVISESQERQKKIFTIMLIGHNKKVWIFDSIADLLPYSFSSKFLDK